MSCLTQKRKYNRKTVAVNLGGGIGLVLDERFVSFALLCLFGLERTWGSSDAAAGPEVWEGRLAVFGVRT